jgi:hypothetical protein
MSVEPDGWGSLEVYRRKTYQLGDSMKLDHDLSPTPREFKRRGKKYDLGTSSEFGGVCSSNVIGM